MTVRKPPTGTCRLTCVLTALALAGLVGCGSEKKTPAAAAARSAEPTAVAPETTAAPPVATPPLDPCALLPKADAETVAGTPLQPATPLAETCTYTAPPTGPTAQVEIAFGDGAKKFLDIDRQLGHAFVTLSGLGDEAYAEENTVFFRKGTMWVSLHLVRLNDPQENRAPLEALARKVAARV